MLVYKYSVWIKIYQIIAMIAQMGTCFTTMPQVLDSYLGLSYLDKTNQTSHSAKK